MLKSLFRRAPKPKPDAQAEIVQHIERVDTIPTLSDTVLRAVALANNPDTSLTDFSNLIRRDATVTAMLLKRANSAACGGAAADVHQAVLRLGLRTCAKMVATVGMKDMLRAYPAATRERCEVILRHSLLVANVASQLNRSLNVGFAGEEFTGGLLHDIGRILISAKTPDVARLMDPLDFDEGPGLLPSERRVLGTDHCAVGGLFASANNLPDTVSRVILMHHQPQDEREHRGLVALVALADDVANHVQRTRKVANYSPDHCGGYTVISSRWLERHHEHFRNALPGLVKAAVRDTRETLKGVAG